MSVEPEVLHESVPARRDMLEWLWSAPCLLRTIKEALALQAKHQKRYSLHVADMQIFTAYRLPQGTGGGVQVVQDIPG